MLKFKLLLELTSIQNIRLASILPYFSLKMRDFGLLCCGVGVRIGFFPSARVAQQNIQVLLCYQLQVRCWHLPVRSRESHVPPAAEQNAKLVSKSAQFFRNKSKFHQYQTISGWYFKPRVCDPRGGAKNMAPIPLGPNLSVNLRQLSLRLSEL